MSTASQLEPACRIAAAAAPHPTLLRAAATTPMDAPTPCGEWDLHALVNHLLYWTPVLDAAGRRVVPAPPAASEQDVDLVVGDWSATLGAALDGLVDTWSAPAAWAGTTSMGPGGELPASMIGGMVLGELVVHGWDLGRTVGIDPGWPEEVLVATHRSVLAMAAQGREMGVFGPEVTVPDGAPTLDRLLAATGRAPDPTP